MHLKLSEAVREHCPGVQAVADRGAPPDAGFPVRKLALLNRIGNAVLQESPIDEVMDAALEGASALLGTPRATVRLVGRAERVFEHRILGFPSVGELLPTLRCPQSGSTLYRDGRPMLACDIRKCGPYAQREERLGAVRLGAFLGVPLIAKNDFLGVLFLDRPEPHRWLDWEVSAAESIGRQIAIAVRHAQLFRSHEELSGKLSALVNNVPGAVYHANPDDTFSLVGDSIAQIAGYPARDFIEGEARWIDLVLPEDRKRMKREFTDAVRLRLRSFRMEYRIRHRDGGIRWIADRHQLRYDETGSPVEVDGLLLDITDRHRNEAEVQDRLRFLQMLIDAIPNPVFYKDAQTRYLGCNRAFEALIGRPRHEIVGKSPFEIAPKDLAETYLKADMDLLAEGGTQVYEGSVASGDGSTRRVVFNKATFPAADGSVGGIVGTILDITELRRVEQALRVSEERYALALRGSNDGIWDWNVHSGEVYFSPRMKDMLGHPEDAPWDHIDEWSSRIHPDDFDHVVARLREHLDGKTPTFEAEYRLRHKDGSHRWILARSVCLADADGNPCRIAGSHTDLTARKHLEGDLLHAQKMDAVGQLASGVAHDFNNMLTAIRGFADLLMLRTPAGAPQRREIEEIIKASDRASSLTQQLLAFSRKQVMQARVTDLNEVVGDMEAMLRRLIGEDIDLVSVCQPGLWKVRVDRGQFEQVILNLVVNARDAMPEGGTLRIETENVPPAGTGSAARPFPPPRIAIRVSDSGVGMDEEALAHIFEPFFTTKEQGKGTGLGLSTVYGIVKQSGGDIEVESSPGRGASFRILLPAHGGDAVEAGGRSDEEAWPRGRETLLLVEDEDAVRRLVSEILEESGYRVLIARDGEEALAVAAAHEGPIHLAITDVVMPRMGGRALADAMAGRMPATRILYMSGYTTEAVIRNGVAHDRVAFLQKPFTPDGLVRKVREVLDGRVRSGGR